MQIDWEEEWNWNHVHTIPFQCLTLGVWSKFWTGIQQSLWVKFIHSILGILCHNGIEQCTSGQLLHNCTIEYTLSCVHMQHIMPVTSSWPSVWLDGSCSHWRSWCHCMHGSWCHWFGHRAPQNAPVLPWLTHWHQFAWTYVSSLNAWVTSRKMFHAFHAVLLPLPQNPETVWHPVNVWNIGHIWWSNSAATLLTSIYAANLI